MHQPGPSFPADRILRSCILAVALALSSGRASAQEILPVQGEDDARAQQLFFLVQPVGDDVQICGVSYSCQRYISVSTTLGATAHVWTGPASASKSSAGDWTKVAEDLVSLTFNPTFSYAEFSEPLLIPSGEARAISIAIVPIPELAVNLEHHDPYGEVPEPEPTIRRLPNSLIVGSTFGSIAAENEDLLVLTGLASQPEDPIDTPLFSGADVPSQLFGALHYTTGADACGDGSLPVVTLPSTLFDGPEPGGVGPLVPGVVYAVSPGLFGWAEVPVGKTLTAQPGTVIALGNGTEAASRINVRGSVDFEDVWVTSIYDDESGGDSDSALGLTPRLPAKGDFQGVQFMPTSTASTWDGGGMRYAGSSPGLSPLHLDTDDVLLQDLVVVDNAAGNGLAADARDRAGASLVDSAFLRNDGLPLGGVAFDTLSNFEGNVAAENGLGNYLLVSGSTIVCPVAGPAVVLGNVDVTPSSYPGSVLVVNGSVCVRSGGSLDLAPGVVIKFPPGKNGAIEAVDGELTVRGTGAFPVLLGSLGNDALLGDTDQDGSDTAQPGDLRGLRFGPDSTGSVRHVEVHDAGSLTPAVQLQSSEVTADAIRVERSGIDGIEVTSLSGDLTNSFVRDVQRDGIRVIANDLDGSTPDIVHATVLDAGDNGIRTLSGTFGGRVLNSIVWNSGGPNFGLGLDAANVESSIGGLAGMAGNLDQDPLLNGYGIPETGSVALDAGTPVPGLLSDHRDNDRSAMGPSAALPDRGALESSLTSLASTPLQAGETVTLATNGSTLPGAPVAYLAGAPQSIYVPGLGLLGIGVSSFFLVGVDSVGSQFSLPLPAPQAGGNSLVGVNVALQGLVLTPTGAFLPTNVIQAQVTEGTFPTAG